MNKFLEWSVLSSKVGSVGREYVWHGKGVMLAMAAGVREVI